MRHGAARRGASTTPIGADLAPEVLAAYEAGLTEREIAEIYRLDEATVVELVGIAGARRPRRARLLRRIPPPGETQAG